MFKFFRNLIPDNYVKGYLDGYTDAETEFLENADYAITAYNNGYKDGFGDRNLLSMSEEDLDVAYWQGYNNGYMYGYSGAEGHYDDWVYTNEDNEEMSTNDDIDQMSANGDNND